MLWVALEEKGKDAPSLPVVERPCLRLLYASLFEASQSWMGVGISHDTCWAFELLRQNDLWEQSRSIEKELVVA
ncbi:hypothetical protein ACFLWV_02250 [Chloroflexota bacterium]